MSGELRLLPHPAPPHSETASDLGGLLTPPFRFGRGGPGGWVPYVWLVDPLGFSLEVYRRVEEGYLLVLTAQGHAVLRVPPFAAVELELGLLWGDRYDPTPPLLRDP